MPSLDVMPTGVWAVVGDPTIERAEPAQTFEATKAAALLEASARSPYELIVPPNFGQAGDAAPAPRARWLPGEAWVGETASLGNASILAVRTAHDADCQLATVIVRRRLVVAKFSYSGRRSIG